MSQGDILSDSNNLALPLTEIPAQACVLVVFGVTGDLTKRMLIPAICNLGANGLLDKNFCIIGIAIESYTTETFREQLKKNINEFIPDPATKAFGLELVKRFYYLSGDFNDSNVYNTLNHLLNELALQGASKSYLFYFAISSAFVGGICAELNKVSLLSENNDCFRRVIIEKPFGHDLESVKKLNQILLSLMKEKQIFRIDHYFGKEPVRNLLVFRFFNSLFEAIWNRKYIDHIQITVAEVLGVGLRGKSYEQIGALADMVPNHLFKILSLIAMEPPTSLSNDSVREENIKLLRAIRMLTPEQVLQQVIRGQYGPGRIGDTDLPGYRSEPNVNPQSCTETYVALKLFIDNERWLNVPFYLRTGKRLQNRTSVIAVQFKSLPPGLFHIYGLKVPPNILRIHIQPKESITIRFSAKMPGISLHLDQVEMNFKYSDYFGIKSQTGYETLLYHCMNGNPLLFRRAEDPEIAWSLMQPILDVWQQSKPPPFPNYAAGSWGPTEADKLLEGDDRKWLI